MTSLSPNPASHFSSAEPTAQYLHALRSHEELTSLVFPTLKEIVPFNKLYVSQTVTEEKREQPREGSENSEGSPDRAMHQMTMASVVKQVEVDLWQKLRRDHRVVVTAPAWTGKSTLCKWVVQHCHTKMHWLPIYVPFRSLSQSSHATLLSYLEQDYLQWLGLKCVTVGNPKPDGSSTTVSLGRWLYDQWQAGQALLILDGADEEFDRTKRESVLSALPTTGTKMTRPRVLLTSRPGGEAGVLGFEKIELQEFTRKQIETLIRKCGVLLDAQEKTHKLLREMKEGHEARAWQFAGRPGHLIQMVVTYIQEGILLTWEEDQMDRIATRRFQVTGRVTPKLEPDNPTLKRPLTEELAFHSLFCRKGQSQTREQMLDLLTHIIYAVNQSGDSRYRPQHASRLLADLCANSGFLKPTRQGLVEWESVSWLQFFAANHLAKKLEPDTGDPTFHHWAYSKSNEECPITLPCALCHSKLPQFTHYLWRTEWQYVLILLSACLSDGTNLLKRIFQEPEDLFSSMIGLYHAVLWRVHNCPGELSDQAYQKLKAATFVIRGRCNKSHLEFLDTLGPPRNRTVLNQRLGRELYMTLKDPSWSVRWAAENVLGGNGRSEMVTLLRTALQDPDKDVRLWAAKALGAFGGSEAVALLGTALQDPEDFVRWTAASALKAIGGPEAVALLRTALQNSDWRVRESAANALGAIGGPEAVALLRTALQDPEGLVRWKAVRGLGEIGGSEVVTLLGAALQDPDLNVRIAVVEALGAFGGSEVVTLLGTALQDPSWNVQTKAASALGAIGGPEAVALLGAVLQDPDRFWDRHLRMTVAKALGAIGGSEAIALLETARQDSDRGVQLTATEALGPIGGPEAVALLGAALQEPDGSVWKISRNVVIEALYTISLKEGLRILPGGKVVPLP